MRPFALAVLLALTAAAEGSLTGRVTDATGGVLPGVRVEARTTGGAPRATLTKADGTYAIDVEPGTYDVTFALHQFATGVHRGVAAPARLDVTLALSSAATVVVTPDVASASEGTVTREELDRRPLRRTGELLETVPGLVVTQHSGEGKANQYYVRGFNLDHGTDLALTVAGVPVNLPTHAHGQGYADANFLIPELVSAIDYRKGPYAAEEGDFATAGAVHVDYARQLERPLALLQRGSGGYQRALVAASFGSVLFGLETMGSDGPWVRPDDYRRINGLVRYTRGALGVTAMHYDARWNATDQIPSRAVASGALPRFGGVDATNGGTTARTSLSAEWRGEATELGAYAMRYRLNLFSNFTYFLDRPDDGDQFEQEDARFVYGAGASHRWRSGRAENAAGVQLRHDDIDEVGLYQTRDRVRLATTRRDRVRQTSGGAYVQTAVQWSSWLRTMAGVRADGVHFEVEAQAPRGGSVVSPKFSAILGPWRATRLYLNAGSGFHSNDARGHTTPLVRTRGAEVGLRTHAVPRLQLAATLWGLEAESELLFVGDAGTTEAREGSRRAGVEASASWSARDWLAVEAEYAHSRARFASGARIPGAVEGVASAAASVAEWRGLSGEVRWRWFGPRPLTDDGSVRAEASSLVSARIGYRITPRVRLDVDAFNLLDAEANDVDYFYTSRLPGEPEEGVDDVHFHPVEGRSFRVAIVTTF